MAATTIFFNGRLISIPGSYSEVDASGLEVVGLGATGVVALVGHAIGGKPWTVVDPGDVRNTLQIDSTGQRYQQLFRSGDLKEGAAMAFSPSDDPDIPGGAVECVFVKANPAAPAAASFNNTDGQALVLTAKDYGWHTNQIRAAIGTGTNKGKMVSLVFEALTETFDDVGGDSIFTVSYLSGTPAKGFTTITAGNAFSVPRAGISSDISNQVTPGASLELVSSSAADVSQQVTIYGLSTTNTAQTETLVCNGVVVVSSAVNWNMIHGVIISGAPAGTVTVRRAGAGATITTLTSVYLSRALSILSGVTVAGYKVSLALGGAGTERVTLWGLSETGATQMEAVQLNGAATVETTLFWSRIDYIGLGELSSAKLLTLSGKTPSLICAFTAARAGLDTDFTNQVAAGASFELVSDSALDVSQTVTIYGTTAANAQQTEQLRVQGLTVVPSTKTWNIVHGAIISGAPAGTVTVQRTGAGLAITTLTGANLSRGLHQMVDCPVAGGKLTLSLGGAGTERVTVLGLSSGGVAQAEVVVLADTAAVFTVASWSRITYLALGELGAAKTLTVAGYAINAPFAGFTTLQKLADKVNGTSGFTCVLQTGNTSLSPTTLDQQSAVTCLSPAAPSFYSNLYAIIAKLNNESQLVAAARGIPGTGAPSNTAAPVFLAGGHEGSAVAGEEAIPKSTYADWLGCLALLRKIKVDHVQVLTSDPAVHAALKAHLSYMAGPGRSERDSVIGIQNSARDGAPTKTEYKAQIININNRNAKAWGQTVSRYNTGGELEVFQPHIAACVPAGMEAGVALGNSLTHKRMNAVAIGQHSSWNPIDDAEEMIQAGALFGETIEGSGRRIVRDTTSHLSSSNIAYTDGAVNRCVNYSVYNFRTEMEKVVGKAGFAGTVGAARGAAVGKLGLLVGVALTAYRSLMVSLTLDVLEIGVEISPVLPITFVKSTIHLVAAPQTAAVA